ncbi:putative DNA-binding protein [Actinacidiphila reveromycinica]|uniref:Putative DNA-binding protein n=1 Tax=Actinacidiphila reveromycinica TaxID=659352 RepID=A0A7U3URP9_9ACTN|nr:helix-turn-helix transcriptional regulator [Streptomyces sp. SN-593]BBA97458.1 putative DNA-binding protein [Streptomyces sp. SN-593]
MGDVGGGAGSGGSGGAVGNDLGDFLRARRELVTPGEVGLPPGNGLRRVPGLRREEVAMLAGISVEYYVRLEQGRDRTPSAQVVDAIAGVLRLDAESTAYLTALAEPRPRRRRGPRPDQQQVVPRGLALLLATANVPVIVFNRYSDVLDANRLARELSPTMVPGVNRLRMLFLDPDAPRHYADWEAYTAIAVAHLRAQVGAHARAEMADERLHALIGELSVRSERFRRLWARHDVRTASSGNFFIRHPRFGELELLVEKFAVVGADGLEALFLHAEPGSRSERALAELAESVGPEGPELSEESARRPLPPAPGTPDRPAL